MDRVPGDPPVTPVYRPPHPSDFGDNLWLYAWILCGGLMAADGLTFEAALTGALLKVNAIDKAVRKEGGSYPLLQTEELTSWIERRGPTLHAIVSVKPTADEPNGEIIDFASALRDQDGS